MKLRFVLFVLWRLHLHHHCYLLLLLLHFLQFYWSRQTGGLMAPGSEHWLGLKPEDRRFESHCSCCSSGMIQRQRWDVVVVSVQDRTLQDRCVCWAFLWCFFFCCSRSQPLWIIFKNLTPSSTERVLKMIQEMRVNVGEVKLWSLCHGAPPPPPLLQVILSFITHSSALFSFSPWCFGVLYILKQLLLWSLGGVACKLLILWLCNKPRRCRNNCKVHGV